MLTLIRKYTRWLHTQWPAGHVEKLPLADDDGSTNVEGLYVVGDIKGIPLLKFSSDTGARAVQTILAQPAFQGRDPGIRPDGRDVLDLVIVGAGVAGMAAALEAKRNGLEFAVYEATEPFSTIVNFPKGKPIYTYPTEMEPAGLLQFSDRADVKERLVEELRAQTLEQGIEPIPDRVERIERRGAYLEVFLAGGDTVLAHRVIVAIGRSGNFRKLGVPGEDRDKVYNRLHDPKEFCDQRVLVVGGGDSALETAIAIASCGGEVTLSYRKPEFSRPKPDNIEALYQLVDNPEAEVAVEDPVSERVTTSAGAYLHDKPRRSGSIRLLMSSKVKEILDDEVVIHTGDDKEETLANDVVFSMIGREAPLGFFRRSGVRIRGEWHKSTWLGFGAFLVFCFLLYHWKTDTLVPVRSYFEAHGWFPFNVPGWLSRLGGAIGEATERPANLLYTLKRAAGSPTFYYSLAYSGLVLVFGIRRIRRRRTPYVTVQTWTLIGIQCLLLFLLPEILLPWAGRNGWFADGSAMAPIADQLFERYDTAGVERAYWRSYGFILAWPLMVWNIFTEQPMWAWIIIGGLQTLVLIPLIIYFWGKGAYCGWICPCGALAETMGDAHRHKMPHGPRWNRLNMVGQAVLAFALLLLLLRVIGWVWPEGAFANGFALLASKLPVLNYKWLVDLLLAGVLGVGCYFWLSGRVWCRFACPLAALMHIYARFSRFRILADKKKCISCNICTSVCHQGIDIMNFANKGLPMEDPQCVRCSACVQSCPTGVLSFGQIDRRTGNVLRRDPLGASPVRMVELTVNGESP